MAFIVTQVGGAKGIRSPKDLMLLDNEIETKEEKEAKRKKLDEVFKKYL